MVKIKREVKMSLDELIKWTKENNIKSTYYKNNLGDIISFDCFGNITLSDSFSIKGHFFVKVEEEITKYETLEVVLELYYDTFLKEFFSIVHRNKSINEIVESSQNECETKCLYLVQEDMSMSLIYTHVHSIKGYNHDDLKNKNKSVEKENDIVEAKRKSENFCEIKKYILEKIEMLTKKQEFAQDSNEYEYFKNLLIAFEDIEYKVNDLEKR